MYMVIGKAKHVIKEQDSTLEGKRNQKCTKFSVCVQVNSSLRRPMSQKNYTKHPESCLVQYIMRMYKRNCENQASRAQKREVVQWVIMVQWHILNCI
jgi:hypothetical protein